MPDEQRPDEVEKFLTDQKSFDARKQSLIEDLLRQRAEAMKAFDEKKADAMKVFDEKLAKLGHKQDGTKPRKSHHKPAPAPEAAAKPKVKT